MPMIYVKKSTAIFLIVTIIVSFAFSGCRKKSAPEKKATFDGIELTYYKVFDDSDVIEPFINDYVVEHPGLKINYRKFSDFDEYQKIILNEMAEGEGPDIFSMQNSWFASNYKKINPMPEEYGTVEDFRADFVDVAGKDLVRIDKNGAERVFAVPMTVDTLALYYNKAHFEDRIPTQGKPSETWEGIKEDVSFLNKPNDSLERFEVAGIAMGRGDNVSRGVDILYSLFLQFGVKFYNENISKATFSGQQKGVSTYPATDALSLFVSFADETQKHYSWNEFMASDDAGNKEVEAFARGKVSMIAGYAYTYDEIVDAIETLSPKGGSVIEKSDIGITFMPQLYDPDISTEKRVTYASYFAETVSRNSKYPHIAWDFLLQLTKEKNLEKYFKKLHKPTSRRDMIESQKKDPIYGVFAAQIGYAESFPILDYYVYKNIFADVIAKANLGGVAKSDLLDAQNEITEMLPPDGLITEQRMDSNEIDSADPVVGEE